MSKRLNCERCEGWGQIRENGHYAECPECEGSGKDPSIAGYSGAEWDAW